MPLNLKITDPTPTGAEFGSPSEEEMNTQEQSAIEVSDEHDEGEPQVCVSFNCVTVTLFPGSRLQGFGCCKNKQIFHSTKEVRKGNLCFLRTFTSSKKLD